MAVKYLITLPCTQLCCERVFNKLKKLKTDSRNALNQKNLNFLLLMYVESDLLSCLNYDDIIDDLAASSSELKRLLI